MQQKRQVLSEQFSSPLLLAVACVAGSCWVCFLFLVEIQRRERSEARDVGSLSADVLWGSFVTHWGRNECVTSEPQRTSAGRLEMWEEVGGYSKELSSARPVARFFFL